MSGIAGVLTTLGYILVVVGAGLMVRRRFSMAPRSQGRLPMEVLGRMALGPKQWIAVVRVGDKVVAVSAGEGGVKPLFDVDPNAVEMLPEPAAAPDVAAFARGLQQELQKRVRAVVRSAALGALLMASGVGTAAHAQAPAGVEAARPAAARQIAAPPASLPAQADPVVSRLSPTMDLRVGAPGEGLRLSGTVGIVVMMGLLTLLPTLVLMMTSFTRIFVVLSFLKQGMGTQSAPPGHLVAALALLLTGFVMQPTLAEVNARAVQPWLNGQMEQAEMLSRGAAPFRDFMLAQTREKDIEAFVEMSRMERAPATADEIPLVVLVSAFVTSELKTAFQIGFMLFLPFIVIDLVVASVLMSMGFFMMPPAMVSLPVKLALFVLVDGWTLVVQSLLASFR
jgi:flagellar biosynthetic protein FliP